MAREDGGSAVVRLDDFEGEIEEDWQNARGSKVLDKNGEEVGTVEELYIWEGPSTVHLIEVDGDERNFLIPSHAVTNVDDDRVKLELGKDKLMQSPEFESDDVPDPETRRAAFGYYGYPDPLDLGGE
jgi:ribosomal 30S subunit maturation factor RimM